MCSVAMQKQCIEFAINARPTCKYMPKKKNSLKYRVWKLVVSTPFESFIMLMIAMNTIILMMKVRQYILVVNNITSVIQHCGMLLGLS